MRVRSRENGQRVVRQLWDGAGEAEVRDVLVRADFETPFEFVRDILLSPGVSVGLHRHERSDECLVLLDGPLAVAHNRNTAILPAPAVALCRAGNAHGILNHSPTATRFLAIGVAPQDGPFEAVPLGDDLTTHELGSPGVLGAEPLDAGLLEPTKAHLGLGEIRFRRVFDHTDFATNWGFVDHAVVPPGTSVGYHRHDTVQECYVITSGRGRMKVDGAVGEVAAGQCIPNRIGGAHGIINHTDHHLEFLNVAVFMNKGHFDATDLDDDLADLL